MAYHSHFARVLAFLFICEIAWADSNLESLLKNNPFGPNKPGAVVNEAGTIELRGVMVEKGAMWFNVYEPATKKGHWVKSGDRVADYRIDSYDRNREMLQITGLGKQLNLALHQNGGLRGASVMGLGRSSPNLASGQIVPKPASVAVPLAETEVNRLELAAVRIRQRREFQRALSVALSFPKVQ